MGIGNWGQELQNAAGAFFGSEYLRDYTHASKTFRSNSYANAPKLKFLFHTYFNINTEAYPEADQQNLGILVKEIKLPSYNFSTEIKNQYNRKRIIQTKIKYDPIQITFHDDNNNSVNKMWYAYYTYYYKDANKPNVMFSGNRGSGRNPNPVSSATQSTMADYNINDIYNDDLKGNDDWGYIGETNNPSGPNQQKVPFFQNITIFGFNQHNFTAYTLINPIINSFSHDTYNYSEGAGIMTNTMTIDYETVVYNAGAIDGRKPGDIVTGFGDISNYDLTESPINIPGARGAVLGQGGLIDGVGGFIESLSNGNIFDAAKIAGTIGNTYKNLDLKSTIEEELKQDLVNIVRDTTVNARNINFSIPVKSSTPSNVGVNGAPTVAVQNPSQINQNNFAGQQIAGPSIPRRLSGESSTGIGAAT
jgi:hypothetical protein